MPRKAAKKYGPGGRYYRQRIRKPDGGYEDVYAKTQTELAEKVTLRRAALAADGVPPKEQFFFEYAAGWYARRAPHLSDADKKNYQREINKVICPVIGGKLIREITSDDIAAVMATRGGLSRSSQKKTISVLKQIFSAAEEAGVIDRLPTRHLKADAPPPEPKRALTEEQAAALLETVSGLKVEPFVMLGLYTGMRRGEICGLRWDSVILDGTAPYIIVRRACRWPDNEKPEVSEILKTHAAFRSIPIPPQLVDYLRRIRPENVKPSAHVYCGEGGAPVSYSALRRRWDTIRARSTASGREPGEKIKYSAGVTVTLDFMPTPHQLRHTYITRLILGGMDLKRVQYLAGHADPAITLQIYTDLMGHRPEDLIDDVTAVFASSNKSSTDANREQPPAEPSSERAEPLPPDYP